ncbi:hypothetical protein [Flavobacterium orientale]|uniref:hypothetical protein n=1 Tax=Flavobacterium orientale TaxID=1756020 RepID=UPI00166591F0|nr:hypothetical protein [Flavobacterium orientale]
MKQNAFYKTAAMLMLVTVMSSCDAIVGIFKAGMGVGIFFVIAIIVVIAYVVMRSRRNK